MTECQWDQQSARDWFADAVRSRLPFAGLVNRCAPIRWSAPRNTSRRPAPPVLPRRHAIVARRDSFRDAIELAAEADGTLQICTGFAFRNDLDYGEERFFAVDLRGRIVNTAPRVVGYLRASPFDLFQLAVVAKGHGLVLPDNLKPVRLVAGNQATTRDEYLASIAKDSQKDSPLRLVERRSG